MILGIHSTDGEETVAAQTVQEANAAVNEALDMMGKKEGVVLITKETPDDGTYSLMITASDGETGGPRNE